MNSILLSITPLLSLFTEFLFTKFFRGQPSREHLRRLGDWLLWSGLAELLLPLQAPDSPQVREGERAYLLKLKQGLLDPKGIVSTDVDFAVFVTYANRFLGSTDPASLKATDIIIPLLKPKSEWNAEPAERPKFPPAAGDALRRVAIALSLRDLADHELYLRACAVRGAMVLVALGTKDAGWLRSVVNGQMIHALAAALKCQETLTKDQKNQSALFQLLLAPPQRVPPPDPADVLMAACRQLFFTGSPSEQELERLVAFVTWTGLEHFQFDEGLITKALEQIEKDATDSLLTRRNHSSSCRVKRSLTANEWRAILQNAARAVSFPATSAPELTDTDVEVAEKQARNQIHRTLQDGLKTCPRIQDPWQVQTLRTLIGIGGAQIAMGFAAERIDRIIKGTRLHRLTYAAKEN